jgi:hypothetical protein
MSPEGAIVGTGMTEAASSSVLPIGNHVRGRGCAGPENVQRIDASRFAI